MLRFLLVIQKKETRAIKGVRKKRVKKDKKHRTGHKIEDFPSGFLFFEQNPEAVQREWNQDEHVFDRMQPEKRSEEKPDEKEFWLCKKTCKSEHPENGQRKKGQNDFRIDMERIKKDRRGAEKNKPKSPSDFFVFPFLPGKEKNLKAQKRCKQAHAKSHKVKQDTLGEKSSQRIKREEKD